MLKIHKFALRLDILTFGAIVNQLIGYRQLSLELAISSVHNDNVKMWTYTSACCFK